MAHFLSVSPKPPSQECARLCAHWVVLSTLCAHVGVSEESQGGKHASIFPRAECETLDLLGRKDKGGAQEVQRQLRNLGTADTCEPYLPTWIPSCLGSTGSRSDRNLSQQSC